MKLTRAAVALARPHGVSVEAELGKVGGMDLDATCQADNVLTEPAEVTRFVDETDCDALAVSIGTSHGVYKSQPTLNIARMKEINAVSRVPLVMHGGSGTPVDQVQETIRNGISKVNIYADCRIAMGQGLRQVGPVAEAPGSAAGRGLRPDRRRHRRRGPGENGTVVLVRESVRSKESGVRS